MRVLCEEDKRGCKIRNSKHEILNKFKTQITEGSKPTGERRMKNSAVMMAGAGIFLIFLFIWRQKAG
jgi:hypothetical protein